MKRPRGITTFLVLGLRAVKEETATVSWALREGGREREGSRPWAPAVQEHKSPGGVRMPR